MPRAKKPKKEVKESKMGRPEKYKKAFCEKVIEVGKGGGSLMEMAVEIGVVKSTMMEWAKKYDDFSVALTHAKQFSQIWWERKGQEGLFDTSYTDKESGVSESRRLNSGVWSRSMAARFPDDWRESKEIKQDINLGNDLKQALLKDE